MEFAFIAPALLMLVFGIIVYSLYFTAVMGVRQAAAEGARAAVAGLSTPERAAIAQQQAQTVVTSYGSLLKAGNKVPQITAGAEGTGMFKVSVSFDISANPIMRLGGFLPLPSSTITANVFVANGSY